MLKILLLCGGKGNERDISLNSVRSVYDHLKGIKTVIASVIFFDTDDRKYLIDEEYLYSNTSDDFRFLLKSTIAPMSEDDFSERLIDSDLVFPVIHGIGGEDGTIQRALEGAHVNYIGSSSDACLKMYNKRYAHEQLLTAMKMHTVPKVFVSMQTPDRDKIITQFTHEQGEVCLKPTEGGSSFGVTFAESGDKAIKAAEDLLQKYKEIVIEKKCTGKEFTIIILDNNGVPVALLPTEIEIKDKGTFDTRRKYMSTTEVYYHCPARFGDDLIQEIRLQAEKLFKFTGARDFLRIDGWILEDANVYFSDFNPISGMEQNSFIFQQSAKIGFTHGTLLEFILRNACKRCGMAYPEKRTDTTIKRRVNILLGGISSERQVSLLSGTNVWMKLLQSDKYAPTPYIITRNASRDEWLVSEIPYPAALLHTTEEIISHINSNPLNYSLVNEIRRQLGMTQNMAACEPQWVSLHDFVQKSKTENAYIFLGLHGGFGEKGDIQALLENAGVDYNGSGPAASALCMDKYNTGMNVDKLGIPKLRSCKKILGNFTTSWEQICSVIGEPIIAKPNGDGCSTGVVKLSNSRELSQYREYSQKGETIPPNTFENQEQPIAMPEHCLSSASCDSILFEEFIKTDPIKIIDGQLHYKNETGWIEITIGVVEKNRLYHVFNPSVTVAGNAILSVEEKFQGGVGINFTPPPIEMMPKTLKTRIMDCAQRVAEQCGIEDYCRIDMFANNKTGEVIVIEINTLPGLSPSTVLFQQAAKEVPSLSPLALLEHIIDSKKNANPAELTFREIASCTGGTTNYTGDDFTVSGVKFDSRDNMKGFAFAAFVTEKDNGHKYISVAAGKGATAAIVSEDVSASIPVIKVSDTVKAYQDIAHYYRSKFSMPIIAITGSNGKTTVKDMLSSVLSAKYSVLATEKNYNNELGVPQTLLKLDNSYDMAVIEMGMSQKGEMRTLSAIANPDIAVITKIGTAHMGNLGGTRADVFNAKMEIVEGLKPNGSLVLCSDDDMLANVTFANVIFCGLKNDSRNALYATDITQFWVDNGYGLRFFVHYEGNKYQCSLPVLGRHNVQNALLALAVGIKLGVPMEKAIEALRIYPRSSMRLETATIRGVQFLKDYYNASTDSTLAALDTLAELEHTGPRIAILGDMLELGEQSSELHRELAEYTIGKVDIVFYTGAYSDAFLSGRRDSRCFAAKGELNSALFTAIQNGELAPGSLVLIKGSNGVRMWEQYEFIQKLLERGNALSAETRLLVDIDALKHNYTAIKHYVGSGVQVVPVVKADAYGSGAQLLANIYSECNLFAVADLIEAEELHSLMPNAQFLVLYQPFASEADWLAERDYIITSVCDVDFIRKLDESALKLNKQLRVHIEIDTGMSRLGVLMDDCETFAKVLSGCRNLIAEGIFTHYSSADMYASEDLKFTARQTELFKKAIVITEGILGCIKYKHACAGAAIFNPKAELFNMVRPGYILRGYYPCEEIKEKIKLRPALKYVTRITQIKEYDPGTSVSYGRHFITQRKTRLAEIPVGYSDGLMRKLSNKGAFVIKGQLAPIVGMISMDFTMVDISDINPPVNVGDEVAVFDNINMTIERMAELCGTTGYEIITNLKNKADRIETF